MSERVVATLAKNSREELRISLSEYRGHDLISLRVFFVDAGVWMHGKAGLSLRIGQLPDLIARLQEAEHAARAEGLLG